MFASVADRRARRAHFLFHIIPHYLSRGESMCDAVHMSLDEWRNVVRARRVSWWTSLRTY
jgi:hypothetical protein